MSVLSSLLYRGPRCPFSPQLSLQIPGAVRRAILLCWEWELWRKRNLASGELTSPGLQEKEIPDKLESEMAEGTPLSGMGAFDTPC